jgi:dipeptidyl aminopeptidase/acylaminoacyl peptidase
MSNINSLILATLFTIILASCSNVHYLAVSPTVGGDKNYEVVPLRKLFANVDTVQGYKLSPDGSQLAWIEVVSGRSELFVKDLLNEKTRIVKTHFIDMNFSWADENRYIVSPVYSKQLKQSKLAKIDTLSSKKEIDVILADLSGSVYLQQKTLSTDGNLLLKHISSNLKTQYYFFNVSTSSKQIINIGDAPITDLLMDKEHVIARVRKNNQTRFIEKYDFTQQKFITISTCNNIDADIKLLSVDQEGFLNYSSNCETDTVQLIRAKSALDKIYFCDEKQHCQFDLEQIITDPLTGIPQFAIYHSNKAHVVNLSGVDYAGSVFFKSLQGTISITSIDQYFNFAIIENSSHLGYGFDLFDLATLTATSLAEPQLAEYQTFLKKAEWVDLQLSNDEHIFGYYYPPQIRIKDKNPAVILLHGGPEHRTYPDYDKEALMLSNRGYSVLSLNYRGSEGFGHAYKNKAVENIKVMLKDVDFAANWLQQNKDIDKNAIGLMGASYGGYLALLASKSEKYQCIVAINSIYDLYDTAAKFPGNSNNFFFRYYGGVQQIETGKYNDYSPIKYDGYKGNKYLLVQSIYDKRIPLQSAVNFYNLIKDKNEVTFTQIEDGHTIDRWYNRLETYRDVEKFLSTCLGGIDGGFEYYLLAKPFYE